jgi:hypothetical protein
MSMKSPGILAGLSLAALMGSTTAFSQPPPGVQVGKLALVM